MKCAIFFRLTFQVWCHFLTQCLIWRQLVKWDWRGTHLSSVDPERQMVCLSADHKSSLIFSPPRQWTHFTFSRKQRNGEKLGRMWKCLLFYEHLWFAVQTLYYFPHPMLLKLSISLNLIIHSLCLIYVDYKMYCTFYSWMLRFVNVSEKMHSVLLFSSVS